jgi:hypothetical protein
MSAIGAQRKHGTLPKDFRSPSENGPSRCGHLTARFAPKQPFAVRMRLCADSYLRDLAVDQVSANGRIRRCAGATCEIACFGFWPTSRCCADPVRASARRPERRRRIASPRGRAPLRRLSRSLRVTRPRSNVRLIVHGTPLVRKSSACEVSQSTVVRGTVKLRQPILSSA